jgi:hypothetical protein
MFSHTDHSCCLKQKARQTYTGDTKPRGALGHFTRSILSVCEVVLPIRIWVMST